MAKDNVIYTPPLNNILAGVTRDLVIKLIHEAGFEFIENAPH